MSDAKLSCGALVALVVGHCLPETLLSAQVLRSVAQNQTMPAHPGADNAGRVLSARALTT